MMPLSSSGKLLGALLGSSRQTRSAPVRESAFARRPIGHATDSTTQCNSCANGAVIAEIGYDFCRLYPDRNIRLRKCEDACRPEPPPSRNGSYAGALRFGVLCA